MRAKARCKLEPGLRFAARPGWTGSVQGLVRAVLERALDRAVVGFEQPFGDQQHAERAAQQDHRQRQRNAEL